jgi:hypothetical protein
MLSEFAMDGDTSWGFILVIPGILFFLGMMVSAIMLKFKKLNQLTYIVITPVLVFLLFSALVTVFYGLPQKHPLIFGSFTAGFRLMLEGARLLSSYVLGSFVAFIFLNILINRMQSKRKQELYK